MAKKFEALVKSLVAMPEEAGQKILLNLISEREAAIEKSVQAGGIGGLQQFRSTLLELAELKSFRDCISRPECQLTRAILGDEPYQNMKRNLLLTTDEAVQKREKSLAANVPIVLTYLRITTSQSSLERRKPKQDKIGQVVSKVDQRSKKRMQGILTHAEKCQRELANFQEDMADINETKRAVVGQVKKMGSSMEEAGYMTGKGVVKVVELGIVVVEKIAQGGVKKIKEAIEAKIKSKSWYNI